MKDSEILDAAADEVLKGWCRGSYGSYTHPEGDVCALGAIARVTGVQHGNAESVWNYEATRALKVYINNNIKYYRYIPEWNDDVDRTAGEVSDVMRSCAKQLRERGK